MIIMIQVMELMIMTIKIQMRRTRRNKKKNFSKKFLTIEKMIRDLKMKN